MVGQDLRHLVKSELERVKQEIIDANRSKISDLLDEVEHLRTVLDAITRTNDAPTSQYKFTPSQIILWEALKEDKIVPQERLYARLLVKKSAVNSKVPNPDPKVVQVQICKMRKKLTDLKAPWDIETFWGQGYILRRVVR